MTTIITRKGLEHWSGRKVPPELALMVDGKIVTWTEVMQNRRARQARILAAKRHFEPLRAVVLEVANYGCGLMGGWQTMLYWIGGSCWVERDGNYYQSRLMEIFPCGLLSFSFQTWKKEFAHLYERRRQCGQPVGVAFLWKRGYELSSEADKIIRA